MYCFNGKILGRCFCGRFASGCYRYFASGNYCIMDKNLSAAKSLKIVAEIIMAVGVFVIISQLFNFRDIAIFASTLISIILMIILENIAIRNFVETQLITTHSKDFVTVIILLSISAFLILLEIIVKYIKIIDENKETK